MERHRRIAALWNWLPAFRGVAEFESVHKAAIDLAVSPSALSRSVRLLEEAVGQALFFRQGAGLKLTPYGQELFRATKDAIRRIDDATTASAEQDASFIPLVSVGTASPMLLAVAEEASIGALRQSVRARARIVGEEEGIGELLRGGIDLLLGFQPERHAELSSEAIGDLRYGTFYASQGGEALDKARQPLVTIAGHLRGAVDLRPALEVSSVAFAAHAARELGGYCVLPEVSLACVQGLSQDASLDAARDARRQDEPASEAVHVAWRKPVTGPGLPGLDVFVGTLRALLAKGSDRPRREYDRAVAK